MSQMPDGASQSRAQWVYDTLRSDIKEGRYAGGARLRERDIAETLGVSRTPVREALLRLVHHGLLASAPGGLVVRELSHRQVLELYATREVLEGAIAGFAARHASPSEISNLRRLAAAFSASEEAAQAGNVRAIWTANRDFHNALYEAAHNEYLLRIVQDVNDPLALVRATTYEVEGRFAAAAAEHEAIVEAIEARNAALAEERARLHIQKSFEARLRMGA
jgi:DNA-binding GntR family transcriptional regulator